MVGEVGHHNMRIIGKPRLCENSIWCLDPRVWIRIRYGSGSGRIQSCWIRPDRKRLDPVWIRIWKLWIRCTP